MEKKIANNKLKKLMLLMLVFILITIVFLFIQYPGFYIIDKTNPRLDIKQNNLQTEGSLCIYIINLKKSKERLKSILPLVKELHIPYKIISAVDGNEFTRKEMDKYVDFKSLKKYLGNYPKSGTIGCSLSHFKAWENFLKSDHQFALILEDDVSFDPRLFKKIVLNSLNIHNLWNILSFDIHHRGMPIKIKKIISGNHNNKKDIFHQYYLNYYLANIKGSGAYLIDRDTALKLLMYSLPIILPIDHFFERASWELDIKFAGVEPRVVFQTFGDSNIVKSNNILKGKKEINISKIIFLVKRDMIRFLHNLKLIIMSNKHSK